MAWRTISSMDLRSDIIKKVWIRWDDLIDRSPFPRKAVNRHTASCKKREVKDTDSFCFFNPNPCSNLIGDCVVRAFSGSMDISWSEAMDRLAFTGETTVNAREIYPKVLLSARNISKSVC